MIGIFDSGTGGISALLALRKTHPSTDICYLADTEGLPYGTKSDEDIRRRFRRALSFFSGIGVSHLLCACGTVSTVALPLLEAPFPVRGTVYAAARACVEQGKGATVGVLATPAAIRSGAYTRAIRAKRALRVVAVPCPSLVPLAESGADPTSREVVREVSRAVAPLCGESCDTVLLGCTHFVRLAPAIQKCLPHAVLVDSGSVSARAFGRIVPNEGRGKTLLFVTKDARAFDQSIRTIAPLPRARLIHIEG